MVLTTTISANTCSVCKQTKLSQKFRLIAELYSDVQSKNKLPARTFLPFLPRFFLLFLDLFLLLIIVSSGSVKLSFETKQDKTYQILKVYKKHPP